MSSALELFYVSMFSFLKLKLRKCPYNMSVQHLPALSVKAGNEILGRGQAEVDEVSRVVLAKTVIPSILALL